MSMGGEIMEEHYENVVIPKLKQEYTAKGIRMLFEELRTDEDLYRAYKDNIAMAFKDEYAREWDRLNGEIEGTPHRIDIHKVANQAADNFLQLLIK